MNGWEFDNCCNFLRLYLTSCFDFRPILFMESLLLRRKPNNPHDSVDVKIIDFGLSKVSSQLCMAFIESGTHLQLA